MALVNGTIVADTPRQARDLLRAQGMTIQRLAPQKGKVGSAKRPWAIASGRHKGALVSFVRELATLLGVGIPLLEAIDTIAKQYKGRFHTVLLMLRDQIASGKSLAEAMGQQPMVFDSLCVSIVEVGQNSGSLETALERLAEFKERSLQFKNRVATALMYPLMVMATGIGVSLFLMTFVVPSLLDTLLEAGHELPLATRIVKGASDLLLGWWWLILVVVGGLVAGVGALIQSETGRLRWHRFQLRIPLVGPMIRKQNIARVSLVVSTLMHSGVVFLKAIQIAGATARNVVLRNAMKRCESAIAAGQDISQALEETGVFPSAAVRVFAAGQQSGKLEEMLDRLAIDYDRQVATASQQLTTILEPVLILLLAVIVGLIAFATMMPILEAGNVL